MRLNYIGIAYFNLEINADWPQVKKWGQLPFFADRRCRIQSLPAKKSSCPHFFKPVLPGIGAFLHALDPLLQRLYAFVVIVKKPECRNQYYARNYQHD